MPPTRRRPRGALPHSGAPTRRRPRTAGSAAAGARRLAAPSAPGGAGRTSTALVSPRPGSARARVERASRPVLLFLHAQPRWLVVALLAALVVVGLLTPAEIGVPCLAVLFVLLAWLAYLAWPAGDTGRRVLRALALALVLGALTLRITAG